MKTFEIIIDRASRYYDIEAENKEEAQKMALFMFEHEYQTNDDDYEYWIAETEEI